jgi:predicted GIY-YIG superfamily endonuclease
MDPKFAAFANSLNISFQALIATAPVQYASLPTTLPTRAVYLFSENGQHLYVGRTNRLRRRLRDHCSANATHFTATFAFRIARKVTGMRATYSSKDSRATLANHAIFGPAFVAAKQRMPAMDIRYVEIQDPIKQALLEIYVAVVLDTPYNDFDNH